MAYQFRLPLDKKQNEEVIANILHRGRSQRNPQQVKWFINHYYMAGIRSFSSLDYLNGTISVSYLDDSGILKFRYEDIIAKYQSQLGRLMGLDLSPAVRTKRVSLDGLRKSSVGQVVLDSAFSQDKVNELKLKLCPPLLMYGTVGLVLWYEGEDSQGIDIVMPWEILPIPVDISGPADVRGLIRSRYVPVEWVKNLAITPSAKSKDYKNLDSVVISSGNMPIDTDAFNDGTMLTTATGGGFSVYTQRDKDGEMASGKVKQKKKDERNIPMTQLIEVWTESSDGQLAEYCVLAGLSKLKELYRYDHSESKYPMPIRIVRDVTVGGFWGRSYIDQLIPLNHEIEMALASMFQAVSDFDLYGIMLWPTTLGTPPLAQRGQDGLKVLRYENDYSSPEAVPSNIQPAKMTGPQIQAVTLATQLSDKLANQPAEMMAGGAPGRVDSSAGLGFLYEVSGIPLSPTAKNIAQGVSGVYKALLRILKDAWKDQKVVEISNLDDSLAGIILDAEAGTLSLSQNSIPFPDEVYITIASEIPISKEQQKMELKEALDKQRITLDEFNFEVRKKGLDIPVGDEIGWQNYRRSMLENLILFGDGEVPGEVIVGPNDLHRIHLTTLQAFTARPEFFASSVEVRNAFQDHIDEHKGLMGQFPEQLPYAEDQAALMMGQGMETMPPQGGFPQ